MKYLTLKNFKFYSGVSFKLILFISFLGYLFANIYVSQMISPLYYSLVKEDRTAAVIFLAKIRNLPDFPAFLHINSQIYGENIQQAVFSKDRQRQEQIIKLESVLKSNPRSRDVFYDLFVLYNEDDNTKKAEEYLRKAKEIDPAIN